MKCSQSIRQKGTVCQKASLCYYGIRSVDRVTNIAAIVPNAKLKVVTTNLLLFTMNEFSKSM
jgi:hypothetical protein